ncbi:MAG TPA: aldehyde dehydrogenase family protein [Phycisphaerales bacterium]|nr:aldehyde dehydrogenase family protein [Phycisphaerales bacterium]HMP37119.1 aldehyde dehydrogenase family protein [Phycisphaerales bacterium]
MSPSAPQGSCQSVQSRRVLRTVAPDAAPSPRTGAAAPSPRFVASVNPATGETLGSVALDDRRTLDRALSRAQAAQRAWRRVPAPVRGEIVRRIGEGLRREKDRLGLLVSLEVGKIRSEGLGEIQEAIDIADFAVGLSRQLYGLSMHSERPGHRMFEQWHPIGTVGVITAFNFPAAVWAWNAMIAAVCGDAVLWKPSLLAPIVAVEMTEVVHRVLREQELFRPTPERDGAEAVDLFPLVIGTDEEVGEPMIADRRLPLISATGSCRMGRRVGEVVARRLGRTLLELGGNNAVIVLPDADLDLVLRAVLFGAVGTAGQRCTTTRRLFAHRAIAEPLIARLVAAYRRTTIGDPLDAATLLGPLISRGAVEAMEGALRRALDEGCEILCGGLDGIARCAAEPRLRGGHFVEPTIIRVPRGRDCAVAREETFAPILYVFEVDSLEEAIERQNEVDQGLSSAIFTDSVRAAERFLSADGSDCGIANVNIGTSGAEIGGAFGGEKDTGGGRESGSDSWKQYMRRQTCTVNFSGALPLAQGVVFEAPSEDAPI